MPRLQTPATAAIPSSLLCSISILTDDILTNCPTNMKSITNPPPIRSNAESDNKPPESDEFDMNESIWRGFPIDLIVLTLSHLPIPSVFRTALLSRSLNSIFSSAYFHSQIQRRSHPPWFLIFPNKGFSDLCVAYDPNLERWIDLSSRLLTSLFRPIAAGDGQISLLYKNASGVHLCISNPITGSHHRIPIPSSLSRYFFVASGLQKNPSTGSFRLVLVGSEQIGGGLNPFVLSAEVFDSGIGAWIRSRSFPVNSPVSSWRALSGGVMYCALHGPPATIVALDTERMVWSVLEAPLPASLMAIRLVDRDGKLVLVGGVGCGGTAEEIGVWQLSGGRAWEVIGWLGRGFCDGFLASGRRLFGCVGGGDLLYFTSKRSSRVAVYDLSRRVVRFLEPSLTPRLLDPHRYISSGFCFNPQMRAVRDL